MNILELLKKSRVNCPHCKAGFELGPDLEAIGETAGKLIDKVSGIFSEDSTADADNSFQEACVKIGGEFDVSPSDALGMLETALQDETILDSICDFLEDDED